MARIRRQPFLSLSLPPSLPPALPPSLPLFLRAMKKNVLGWKKKKRKRKRKGKKKPPEVQSGSDVQVGTRWLVPHAFSCWLVDMEAFPVGEGQCMLWKSRHCGLSLPRPRPQLRSLLNVSILCASVSPSEELEHYYYLFHRTAMRI